jgi:LuxR family maltose regulon positive regulatory protein
MSILPTVLIHQKQNPPPLASNTISRPRLLAQLDKTLHRHAKLTLLSAQAGSGKTTLLIQWCALLEKGQILFYSRRLSLDKS